MAHSGVLNPAACAGPLTSQHNRIQASAARHGQRCSRASAFPASVSCNSGNLRGVNGRGVNCSFGNAFVDPQDSVSFRPHLLAHHNLRRRPRLRSTVVAALPGGAGGVVDTSTQTLEHPVGAAASTTTVVPPPSADPVSEAQVRLQRLEVLVLLRRLYRDVIRSERVLEAPLPTLATGGSSSDDESGSEGGGGSAPGGGGGGAGPAAVRARSRVKNWVQQVVSSKKESGAPPMELVFPTSVEVVEYADDIRDLAQSLRRDMANMEGLLQTVFLDRGEAEAVVARTVADFAGKLERRAVEVESSLSEGEREEAQRLRDEALEEERKNDSVSSRVLRRLESLPSTSAVLDRVRSRLKEVDLNAVQRNLSSVNISAIQERVALLVEALFAMWRRLNGTRPVWEESGLVKDLPRPVSLQENLSAQKTALILEVEALDQKLAETSRARDKRVREKNILARTRIASEIQKMDDEVNLLRKKLAVRTLQLEMLVIYSTLNEELLLISEDIRNDEEESLVVAEFGLLDADLSKLLLAVDRNETILIEDEELEILATDIPDLKMRLGIRPEAPSIPLKQRLQMWFEEGWGKLQDGVAFFSRGLRLLSGDVVYSGRLIWVAIKGTTLSSREVQTMRRTARDLLAIVPFTIILIIPITPVGHVMAFSFIQRYFPGLFPSAFSTKRQNVMRKYDAIREQMRLAATEREKAEAAQAVAAAEAETFEAGEGEDEGPEALGLHGGEPKAGPLSSSSEPKRTPRSRLILQERLPEMARRISLLREEGLAADGDSGRLKRSGLMDGTFGAGGSSGASDVEGGRKGKAGEGGPVEA